MKANKFFRVISGLLALILAIALLGVIAITVLPRFGIDFFSDLIGSGIVNDICIGIDDVTLALSEIVGIENIWESTPLYLVISISIFALPALLLLIAAIILFTRQKRGKGKFVFAVVLAMLGLVIFVGWTEYYATTLLGKFDENVILYSRIGIGAYAALLILCMVLGLVGKKKSPVIHLASADTTNASAESASAENVEQFAFDSATESSEQNTEPYNAEFAVPEEQSEEPAKTWDEEFVSAATAHAEQQEYVPEEAKRTTSDVLEHTYQQTENLSEATVKKLHTLRSLLNAHAITQDEYTKLVDRYLHDSSK